MDDYGLLWQEELIQPTNLENHIILASEIKAPIRVSERLMSKFHFREYISSRDIAYGFLNTCQAGL